MSATLGPSDEETPTNLRRRVLLAIGAVVALVFIYANVYRWAVLMFTDESRTLMHSLQVTIEALTTAGFGGDTDLWQNNDPLALLVIAMNLSGVLLVFLALPLFAVPLFRQAIDTAPPTETRLRDHVVICGYSAMDDVLRRELDDAEIPYLFIEADAERAKQLHKDGLDVIYGNAERSETLHRANVEFARAVVADLDDETNPTVIISADRINPDSKIISVVQNRDAVPHHKYAGADEVVVSKYGLGESLARRSIQTVSEQVQACVSIESSLSFDEVLVEPGSDLIGKTLREATQLDEFGITVVGGWFGARFRISPPPDTEIVENAILLTTGGIGSLEDLGLRRLPEHRPDTDSVIVCGYGDVGQAVTRTLREEDVEVTVIERRDMPGVDIQGDITEEQTLRKAGAAAVRSVVLATDDDATAVYAAILLEQIAPKVETIARANDRENVWKLYNAGADYVLSLPDVTGEVLASTLIGKGEILTPRDPFEFVRTETPSLVGQTLSEADVRNVTGCTVVAVERGDELVTNLGPNFAIESGDILIAAGSPEAANEFRRLAGVPTVDREEKEE